MIHLSYVVCLLERIGSRNKVKNVVSPLVNSFSISLDIRISTELFLF